MKKDFRENEELINSVVEIALDVFKAYDVKRVKLECNGGLNVVSNGECGNTRNRMINIWIRSQRVNLRIGTASDVFRRNRDLFERCNNIKADTREVRLSCKDLATFKQVLYSLNVKQLEEKKSTKTETTKTTRKAKSRESVIAC